MMDAIKVEGIDELVAKLKKLDGMSEEMLGESLLAGALVLEGKIKVSMQQTPKGGRTYQRGSKSHTASTPGSPPAIDYGNLINSVQSKRDGKDAVVFTNAESAPPLEFGTAKMQARPFMRPAAENFKVDAAKAVEATAKRKLDEAAR